MEHPRVKPRIQKDKPDARVYADLDELIRLQYKATGFSFLPRQPVHSILAGRHASRLRGRGLNFEEIRRYRPGDDIRNMDWKVTARMRKPHVRVYTEERDRPVLLVVDQRITMFFGSRQTMKSVTAAEAAALSAWRVLDKGDRVGAIVFDDKDMEVIPPLRSREQVMRILKAIVKKNIALGVGRSIQSNPAMLNEALERAARLARHDYLVCSISDGVGADDESIRLVTKITEHNDMIAVLIYDPLEADLPDAGTMVMAEEEQQLEVNTSDRRLRSRFSEDFEQRLEWMRRMSRLRSIPLLPVHTAEGVAEQVRKLLGQNMGARRF
ncbi:MAG: DUF58 domain-containing protein [Planctomycetota bacterium]|jgi:uncharacterized protein (DUF58 family)